MSIHVCKCTRNGREEYHLRYPGMTEAAAHELADRINGGWLRPPEKPKGMKGLTMDNTCTVLPDGSAFATASWPLPKDHWLYAPRGEWDSARDEYAECPLPILTNAQRQAVTAAARYAIRCATMCGQDQDFDPDAMVLNMAYALCGLAGGALLAANVEVTGAARLYRAASVWTAGLGFNAVWPTPTFRKSATITFPGRIRCLRKCPCCCKPTSLSAKKLLLSNHQQGMSLVP